MQGLFGWLFYRDVYGELSSGRSESFNLCAWSELSLLHWIVSLSLPSTSAACGRELWLLPKHRASNSRAEERERKKKKKKGNKTRAFPSLLLFICFFLSLWEEYCECGNNLECYVKRSLDTYWWRERRYIKIHPYFPMLMVWNNFIEICSILT